MARGGSLHALPRQKSIDDHLTSKVFERMMSSNVSSSDMRLLSWPSLPSSHRSGRSTSRLSSRRSESSSSEDSDKEDDELDDRQPFRRSSRRSNDAFELRFAWVPIPHLSYSSDDPLTLERISKWIRPNRDLRASLPLHGPVTPARTSSPHTFRSLKTLRSFYTAGAWITIASTLFSLALLVLQAWFTLEALYRAVEAGQRSHGAIKRSLPMDSEVGGGSGPIQALVSPKAIRTWSGLSPMIDFVPFHADTRHHLADLACRAASHIPLCMSSDPRGWTLLCGRFGRD